MEAMMKYLRMPIEAESPEQLGYDRIRFNLAESSVRDRSLRDLGLNLDDTRLCYEDHFGHPGLRRLIAQQGDELSEELSVALQRIALSGAVLLETPAG